MDALPSILQIGGGWGNVSGPGLCMIRAMTASILSSVIFGMTGASIGSFIWDTAAIPFLASAVGGFAVGAFGFYRDSLRKALFALERYPRLLQLHLEANFSHRGFESWTSNQLRSAVFARDWQLQGMLITAWMTANPTIERIRLAKEEELINGVEEKDETK